jgi:hypothetical protein
MMACQARWPVRHAGESGTLAYQGRCPDRHAILPVNLAWLAR